MSEPYNLSLDAIGKLDRWQIIGVYFTPRDKHNTVIGTGRAPPQVGPKQAFFEFWRIRHLPEYRIEEIWEKVQAEKKERMAAQRARKR